jgi:hypothetical protein
MNAEKTGKWYDKWNTSVVICVTDITNFFMKYSQRKGDNICCFVWEDVSIKLP